MAHFGPCPTSSGLEDTRDENLTSRCGNLSVHMEHDFSNGGRKNRDFSWTNREVKRYFCCFIFTCMFISEPKLLFYVAKKSEKKRVVFRLCGTLKYPSLEIHDGSRNFASNREYILR